MTAATLLADLTQRGVLVRRDGDRIALEGARASLSPALLERVRALKPALLEILSEPIADAHDEILYEERLAMRLEAGFSLAAAQRLALSDIGRTTAGSPQQGFVSADDACEEFDAAVVGAESAFLTSVEEIAAIAVYATRSNAERANG